MINTKNVYIVGNQTNYAKFIFDSVLVTDIKDADIVLFTGGEDVDPSLYNCEKHTTTYSNICRDLNEKQEFKKIRQDQLAIGICRGSQFLCVMNKGLLIQNVTNHCRRNTHLIKEVSTCKCYDITSTHHQMQYPFNISQKNFTCLFYTPTPLSTIYEGDKIINVPYEPEIVLYHNPKLPKCLAIQGHPEYMRLESPIVIRLNDIINELVKKHEN